MLKIILKEDIELYRYLIAKATFLQTHKEYRLVESFLDSNCFLVANRKTKEKVFVSLFKQPTKEPDNLECKKFVYIQNANTKIPEGFDVERADKEFNDQLAKNIRLGFLAPDQLVEQFQGVFKEDVETYFKKAEAAIREERQVFVKYYAKKTIEKNPYQVVEGNVSFSHPKHFNDPFDCNCYYADGHSMMDFFRVFCFTHAADNILMWSYYANSHAGYALEYSYASLLDKIHSLKVDGLCVYGPVEYIDKRPNTRSNSNQFSYSNLNFYIKATFAKFKEWQHEREYRIVCILDENTEDAREVLGDWVVIPQVDVVQGYAGCNNAKIKVKAQYPVRKLEKDILNYQLK